MTAMLRFAPPSGQTHPLEATARPTGTPFPPGSARLPLGLTAAGPQLARLSLATLLSLLLGLLLAFAPAAPALATPAAVAEITLVAGSVWRHPGEGKEQALKANDKVFEGDRIVTGSGAVAHLKFIDGAHVGLREGSELRILAYRAQPMAVNLELSKGTLRHISGEYAKKSRETFRLNTPIAAIGVRGTDFITGLRDQKTFALLLEGAIYLSPGDCRANCPRTLIDLPQTLATMDLGGRVETRQIDPAEIRNLVGNQRLAQAAGDPANPRQADTEKNRSLLGKLPEAKDSVEPKDPRPALVWSRWLASGRLDESFSRENAEMAADPAYQARITNLYYTLWRKEDSGSWTPGGGTVSLRLDQAAARYYDGYLNLPVTVERGSLELGLNDRSFATRLEGRLSGDVPRGLESLAHSQTLIDARGTIDTQGRFVSTTPRVDVSGVIALDKNSAGYLFETPVLNGNLQGVTSWKR
ncbi:MAG: FecR domain-containing protein [Azonexus sp.]|nr:FecR domain-containing protein [Azonexus sp.]MCK6411336.1 FecR domain-containing protein [Azonexus sp.]